MFDGVDEFEELQICVEDRINVVSDFRIHSFSINDKLVGLDDRLDDVSLQHAVYNTIIYRYKHSGIVTVIEGLLTTGVQFFTRLLQVIRD